MGEAGKASRGLRGTVGLLRPPWQAVPSSCSQGGNNPLSRHWGPRQIPELLAGVSAHLELSSLSGPREPV